MSSYASVSPQTYTISASAGSNGSITSSSTVSCGDSKTIYFTPSSGYEIDYVSVDGYTNSTAKANGYYTFSGVTANHTVSAYFKQIQYTITASAGSYGSISPSGTQSVTY